MATVQLFRREALNFDAVRRDRPRSTATPTSSRSSTTRCSTRRSRSSARSPSALIIWYGGGSVLQRHADARRARRLPAVLAALLPADQRHVGEVQRPAGGDGVVGADLRAARRAGARSSRRRRRSRGRAPARGPHRLRARLVRLQRRRPTAPSEPDWVLRDVSLRGRARASASASSARPGRARRRSSTCCCGSTTCSAGGSRSTASTSASWTSAELRGLFSLVLQDVHLFSGTIADNIRLGQRRRSTTSGVRRAAAGGARRRVHRAAAGRLRRAGRRARRDAVGRAEAAAVVRARARLRSARADPRRGDVERRHRDRAADPRRAARADGRADDDRHRASAVDDSGHGQDPGAAQGRSCARRARTRSCWRRAGSTSSCSSCSTSRSGELEGAAAERSGPMRRALPASRDGSGASGSGARVAAVRRRLKSRSHEASASSPADSSRAAARSRCTGLPAELAAPRCSSTCRRRSARPWTVGPGVHDRVDAVVAVVGRRRPAMTEPTGRSAGSAAATPSARRRPTRSSCPLQ